ncbi:hypothetical protein Rhal01_01809 [Rubritalea halochordaticola]|uniref:Lipoprotein n=1 Tax=Rubritalea halochordaticola TaxID=714537 RepID=A0ABP9UZ19_9BACT
MWKYAFTAALMMLGVSCSSTLTPDQSALSNVDKHARVRDMPVAWDSPNIYEKYDPKGKSALKKSWTRKFDASGISFNDKRTCTLVTRQHVVMARHYKRSVGEPVVLHDRRGWWCQRTITKSLDVYGDVAIGLLDEPVPASYKVYPLLVAEPKLEESLLGELVIVTDQNRRLFVHEVASVRGTNIRFTFDEKKQIGFGKRLVSGDSGNPSFVIVGGEPVLIETHTTGGWGAGPFYGSALLQQKLEEAIRALGAGGSLRTVRWQ